MINSNLLNPASIFPHLESEFFVEKNSYYRETKKLKEEVRLLLADCLGCNHKLYFVSCASAGLINLLYSLTQMSLGVLRIENALYPPYKKLFDDLQILNKNENGIAFITHISPLTGDVVSLEKKINEDFLIVDAAHSLGTIFQNELFLKAEIFFAPLHKHLGLVTGLGIIGVDLGKLPSDKLKILIEILELVENNHWFVPQLLYLKEKILKYSKDLHLNTIRIFVGDELKERARKCGFKIITSPGMQAHSVTFCPYDNLSITEILNNKNWNGKIFLEENAVRLSFHSAIHGKLTPKELEDLISELLLKERKYEF